MKRLLLAAVLSAVRAGAAEPMTLAQTESTALSHHPTIHLAEEETRVARLKKSEAYRGIWPLLSLKGEITEGVDDAKLNTPDFLEESYGVQLTQPLIQGGRLVRTYKQSKNNYLSVKAKEEKTRQEVLFGARESHWNLVKALHAETIFDTARKDLEKDRKMADELIAKEVISRQVYETMVGQAEQAVLNQEAAWAETTSRLWQWTAALGLNEPPAQRPPIGIPPTSLEWPSLDECLKEAREVHPDILVQKYTMEAARYGDLAGRGLYYPRLSVNGFYGKSGAAYENEDFEFKEDWQIGAQISQYFGGSSLNASAQDIKTSPKLGQSSRTRSRTYAGSLGIEDSLKTKTEKGEARLAYHQAAEDFRRTDMEVANTVRAAYADWAKARSQARISQSDFAIAKTEYEVSLIKSSNREVPVSERCLTRNRLAQAEVSYIDAQAQLKIAAAALARAIGRPNLIEKELP